MPVQNPTLAVSNGDGVTVSAVFNCNTAGTIQNLTVSNDGNVTVPVVVVAPDGQSRTFDIPPGSKTFTRQQCNAVGLVTKDDITAWSLASP